jgi:L-alanine-DL-glutamate epimerase-like enolase superfamily enzyme
MATKEFNSGAGKKHPSKDSRREFIKKATLGGLAMDLLTDKTASTAIIGAENPPQDKVPVPQSKAKAKAVITDMRCALIGNSPVVRIVTNKGISGYGQAETAKSFLKPYVLFYKDYLIGMDPTDVERIMMKIRRLGGFKPWGAAVSAIEMALWDVAGKIAGLPVYKLLGGKIRDHVRVYGRTRMTGTEPGDYAKAVKASKEGFTIIKQSIGFHANMDRSFPGFYYGDIDPAEVQANRPGNAPGNRPPAQSAYDGNVQPTRSKNGPYPHHGVITEKGMKAMINQVAEWKKGLGDEIGLALDCGPGFAVSDAIRLARALEPFNLMWLEDLLTGDYHPYVMADLYKEVTQSTTTPIHTGEQIYLRQNFRELIEQKAVRVIGPDPGDIGGIAEMKWVAEYADLHGIQIAPHGIFDGPFGLAAQVQAGAAMPENYIAFEYPMINPQWWFEILEGLPDPLVKNGVIEVWDRPGLGVDFKVEAAKKHLSEEDKGFFD